MGAHWTGLDAAIGELEAALDAECLAGGLAAAEVVADEARANHPYQNRTGRLESRTVPGTVRGRVTQGELRVRVFGETRYGSYLEEGTRKLGWRFRFLLPAYERTVLQVERALDDAMQRAAVRAGWT